MENEIYRPISDEQRAAFHRAMVTTLGWMAYGAPFEPEALLEGRSVLVASLLEMMINFGQDRLPEMDLLIVQRILEGAGDASDIIANPTYGNAAKHVLHAVRKGRDRTK